MRWIVAFAAAMMATVASAAPVAAQEGAHAVSFDVPLGRSPAIERATEALTTQGYTIQSVKPDVLTTSRRDVERICHLRLFAKFFAIDDSTTRVVVTGDYTIEMAQPEPRNVEESSRGIAGDMWNELQAAADNIKRVSITTPSP